MKVVFLILLVMTVPSLSFCQSSQAQETKPKLEGPSLPQRQIVALPLPKHGYRPKLTLQQALKIGEHYIELEKLDLSSYDLFEAKFVLWGGNVKDPRWLFVWLNSGRASKTQGVDFQLTVTMEGTVGIIPSM